MLPKKLFKLFSRTLLRPQSLPPVQHRFFKNNFYKFSTLKPGEPTSFSKTDYLRECNNFFGEVTEKLENNEHPKITDISYTDGVLKIDCIGGKTFVINRQVPNKQLWYSSPISGPARYEFDGIKRRWVSISKDQTLDEILFSEIDLIK